MKTEKARGGCLLLGTSLIRDQACLRKALCEKAIHNISCCGLVKRYAFSNLFVDGLNLEDIDTHNS